MKEPKAYLINWTSTPLHVMHYIWLYCKEPARLLYSAGDVQFEPPQYPLDVTHEEGQQAFRTIMAELSGIPEFIVFNWVCVNIPRAMLAQLSRHRHISLFTRSFRDTDMGSFFATDDFYTPPGLSQEQQEVYEMAMSRAADSYTDLVRCGLSAESARGLLPMHVNIQLCMSTNLRALAQLISSRTCWMAQQGYWAPFMASMRDALCNMIDPVFAELFKPPCETTGRCQLPEGQRRRMAGVDPGQPCPRYVEREKANNEETIPRG
jgi:hypothetical protein